MTQIRAELATTRAALEIAEAELVEVNAAATEAGGALGAVARADEALTRNHLTIREEEPC